MQIAPIAGRVHVDYDKDSDLLFAYVGELRPADYSIEVEPGVSVSLIRGRVSALEIVDCAAMLKVEPKTIAHHSYVRKLIDRYGKLAVAQLGRARVA